MPQPPERPLRVCLFGATALVEDALAGLRPRLPHATAWVLIGAWADHPSVADVTRLPAAGEVGCLQAVEVAATAFPGESLILIDADRLGGVADLPEYACERLLRALDLPDVLVACALDDIARRPFPADCAVTATAQRIDALCYAYSARVLIEDADIARMPPLLSAWHGPRLAGLGPDGLRTSGAMEASGLRAVMLDHLYVASSPRPPQDDDTTLEESRRATPTDDPRDPAPPSPLTALRERVASALPGGNLPGRPGLDDKPVLLHVLHGWGGGAQRWVRDFAAAGTDAQHLALIARGSVARRRHGEWLELHDGRLDGPPLRRIPLPRPIADSVLADAAYRTILDTLIGEYCIDAIVLSSLIGHSLDVLHTGLPTLRVVHDHYPLWPLLHRDFGDPALRFDAAQRAADLASAGSDYEFAERDPARWQRLRDATVAGLCESRATLVAPSRSALANELRLAPELSALPSHIVAHGFAWPAAAPRAPQPPQRRRLRLVLPGRIRRGKGAELLAAALPALLEHAELFLLGAGSDAHALFGQRDVHMLLDYRHEAFPELVAQLAPDAALLLPTVAETFSYTLSELRGLGLPVIATRVGALAERIRDGVDGFLIEPQPQSLIARVSALAAKRSELLRVRATLADWRETTAAEMAARYHAILALGQRPVARYPLGMPGALALETAAHIDQLRRSRQRESALAIELAAVGAEADRRGDWGHELDRQLGERTRWALALDAELGDIKPRYEQMLASSSWRWTAPLRSANARLHALRTGLSFRGTRLRSVIRRVRVSLAQRGFAATLKRIVREFRPGTPLTARQVFAAPRRDVAPFALPGGDGPRVSIVMPVFNNVVYTTACLRSLAEHAADIAFEVIVVDDASTDSTPQRLDTVAGIRVLRNAANLGFVGSCNAGAAAARGEFVLFLNNDTIVTAGWLGNLLRCFEEEPGCGLVGARLVYPDGRLQEAGGIVFNDGSAWNYGRFGDPDDPAFGFRREADYCSGAAIMLRRDLFERLGGFDARYAPAYYEDTDLAFAVRATGRKVFYEPGATVVHFEGVTAGTDPASGIKRHQAINHEAFLAKWKGALAAQPASATPIARAATWRAKKRVLIVDATAPTPDMDSGSLRMVNLMRILHQRGCHVSFLPDNRAWMPRYTPALQALGVEALYHPFVSDPVALFRERGQEFDAIVLSRHYVAASYVGLARLYAPRALLAFDTVDLHYLREQRAGELEDKPELQRRAAVTRAQELKLMRECDVTFVVSSAERELLVHDAPGVRVEVLSNVHEVYGCRRTFAERRDLVFVGGFQHPPNIDAVIWFVRDIFPLVGAQLPDVHFHVIGSRMTDEISALAGASVHVHGYVEDIAPFMDGCRIAVAPLRYGAGVKGKVNLAMSYGLPVVATPSAVEGMRVDAGEDVLVAAAAAEFAAAVVGLYRDEALWRKLSANGLDNVREHFSFETAGTVIDRVFGL
ncbi:MAG TPA: glycosyltransferase [Rhodanobacteraceae bacterium]|nr:glycosyltransferase [Rhodanobacteraceae bacterium]